MKNEMDGVKAGKGSNQDSVSTMVRGNAESKTIDARPDQGVRQGSGPDWAALRAREPRKSLIVSDEVWNPYYATLSHGDRLKVRYCPERFLNGYKRTLLGIASRSTERKVGCQMCMGWEDIPASIRDCTARTCPSYAKRPYQKKKGAEVAANGGY